MRGLYYGFIMLILGNLSACGLFEKRVELTAMTYNIRTDWQQDGDNNWQFRRDQFTQMIVNASPDILGMQELRPHQLTEMKERLSPDYASYGLGRDDGIAAGEFAPLFYRKDRFSLINARSFWCSPTPEVPSKGWDSALNRIVTYTALKDLKSGETLTVINTHFDHKGHMARLKCAELIVRTLQDDPAVSDKVILMGDFNFDQESKPFAVLNGAKLGQDISLFDSLTVSETDPKGPPYTFNAFDPAYRAPSPIDMIFISDTMRVHTTVIDDTHHNGRFPSDHFPVIAKISY